MPWAVRFGFDIFHTSQEAWDTRFVSHSTRVRTIAVDAGTSRTTQFNLTQADQDMLINNGRAATSAFLAGSRWPTTRTRTDGSSTTWPGNGKPRREGAGREGIARPAARRVDELDEPAEHVGVGLRQHAVAEVEDVPGRPPARASTSSAPASTRSHGPSSSAGSRLPWTPRSSPTTSQPASSGTRQSSPITSPPARASSASSGVGDAGAEVDRRHVDRREDRARSTARRTPRSRPARARRPRSRRAGSRRRRRATFAAT